MELVNDNCQYLLTGDKLILSCFVNTSAEVFSWKSKNNRKFPKLRQKTLVLTEVKEFGRSLLLIKGASENFKIKCGC